MQGLRPLNLNDYAHVMKPLSKKSLSDEELEELDLYLAQIEFGRIPSVEALDGFFAALACCPDLIRPSEFLEVIKQDEQGLEELIFEDLDDAILFNELVMRQYNDVNRQFDKGDIYFPLLLPDEDEKYWGNDWAAGFLQGVSLRREIWSEIIDSEDEGGSMVPIFILAHEHSPDPEMRPFEEPMSDEKRETVITQAIAGVNRMHAYFRDQRPAYLGSDGKAQKKVGRNEPCPCGSGQKFKKCCGTQRTLH